jgi:hypothetical protein
MRASLVRISEFPSLRTLPTNPKTFIALIHLFSSPIASPEGGVNIRREKKRESDFSGNS